MNTYSQHLIKIKPVLMLVGSFLCLILPLAALPQETDIGQEAPGHVLANRINFPEGATRLTDFKGKVVILDFWATFCRSCIESWPKLLKLQRQFADRIQIVLVNPYESEQVIRRVIEQQKRIRGVELDLPMVFGDPVLGKTVFKPNSLPHLVWLDEDAKMIAVTEGGVLNEQNITAVLKGNHRDLAQKVLQHAEIDYRTPIFVDGNGDAGNALIWRTVFSRYVGELTPVSYLTANEDMGYQVGVFNAGIRYLYRVAYSDHTNIYGNLELVPSSRTILQVTDTTQYVELINGESRRENLYVYQAMSYVPTTREKIRQKMRTDLAVYFGLDVRWEKRKMPCLVLETIDSTLFRFNGNDGPRQSTVSESVVQLNDTPMDVFFHQLTRGTQYANAVYPILNETQFKGNVGPISFETDVHNPESLDQALRKYGLSFTMQSREVDVLVLREPSDD